MSINWKNRTFCGRNAVWNSRSQNLSVKTQSIHRLYGSGASGKRPRDEDCNSHSGDAGDIYAEAKDINEARAAKKNLKIQQVRNK